jgi:hypothetical protein
MSFRRRRREKNRNRQPQERERLNNNKAKIPEPVILEQLIQETPAPAPQTLTETTPQATSKTPYVSPADPRRGLRTPNVSKLRSRRSFESRIPQLPPVKSTAPVKHITTMNRHGSLAQSRSYVERQIPPEYGHRYVPPWLMKLWLSITGTVRALAGFVTSLRRFKSEPQ